jgi:hypothetical protein
MADGPGAVDLRYAVDRDSSRSAFFIKRDGRELLTAPDDGTFLALFDEDVVIELQKLRRDLYFVHAAVLTSAGGAFMLVTESGGGKSTLCWALSHHEFRYLSDELGPIDLETLRVHPFTRALMLKTDPPGSSYPVPRGTLRTSRGWHVAAQDLPGGVAPDPTRLTAVFFLRRDLASRVPSVRPISAAAAAARLYANTLNALAHESDGLDAAVRVTTGVASFELVTAELAATCRLLAATLKGIPPYLVRTQ